MSLAWRAAARHWDRGAEVFGLADRLGRAVSAPVSVGDELIVIDASIGMAFSLDGVSTAEALVEQADRTM